MSDVRYQDTLVSSRQDHKLANSDDIYHKPTNQSVEERLEDVGKEYENAKKALPLVEALQTQHNNDVAALKKKDGEHDDEIEELQDSVWPLSVGVSVMPSVGEYSEDGVKVSVVAAGKRKGDYVLPEEISGNAGGEALAFGTATKEGTEGTATVKGEGKLTASVTMKSGRLTTTGTASFHIVRKSRAGIAEASALSGLDVTALGNAALLTSAARTVRCKAEKPGYLWIATPYRVSRVATDPNFTFGVAMVAISQQYNGTGGLNYYRSEEQIDVSDLTYYIR